LTPSIARLPVVVETVSVIVAPAAPFAARLDVHAIVAAIPALTAAPMVIVRTPLTESLEETVLFPTSSLTVQLQAASPANTSVPVDVMIILSVLTSAVSSVCVKTILVGVKPVCNVFGAADVATTPV
jgi:hypothetical protein